MRNAAQKVLCGIQRNERSKLAPRSNDLDLPRRGSPCGYLSFALVDHPERTLFAQIALFAQSVFCLTMILQSNERKKVRIPRSYLLQKTEMRIHRMFNVASCFFIFCFRVCFLLDFLSKICYNIFTKTIGGIVYED